MKISTASKKVLASALSAAMVVAFAPTVAFGDDLGAGTVETTPAGSAIAQVEYTTASGAKAAELFSADGKGLAEAFEFAGIKGNATVKLLDNVTADVTVYGKTTLDLNGFTFSGKGLDERSSVTKQYTTDASPVTIADAAANKVSSVAKAVLANEGDTKGYVRVYDQTQDPYKTVLTKLADDEVIYNVVSIPAEGSEFDVSAGTAVTIGQAYQGEITSVKIKDTSAGNKEKTLKFAVNASDPTWADHTYSIDGTIYEYKTGVSVPANNTVYYALSKENVTVKLPAGELTVTDSSEAKTGKIDGNEVNKDDNGETAVAKAAISTNNQKLVIKGGTFTTGKAGLKIGDTNATLKAIDGAVASMENATVEAIGGTYKPTSGDHSGETLGQTVEAVSVAGAVKKSTVKATAADYGSATALTAAGAVEETTVEAVAGAASKGTHADAAKYDKSSATAISATGTNTYKKVVATATANGSNENTVVDTTVKLATANVIDASGDTTITINSGEFTGERWTNGTATKLVLAGGKYSKHIAYVSGVLADQANLAVGASTVCMGVGAHDYVFTTASAKKADLSTTADTGKTAAESAINNIYRVAIGAADTYKAAGTYADGYDAAKLAAILIDADEAKNLVEYVDVTAGTEAKKAVAPKELTAEETAFNKVVEGVDAAAAKNAQNAFGYANIFAGVKYVKGTADPVDVLAVTDLGLKNKAGDSINHGGTTAELVANSIDLTAAQVVTTLGAGAYLTAEATPKDGTITTSTKSAAQFVAIDGEGIAPIAWDATDKVYKVSKLGGYAAVAANGESTKAELEKLIEQLGGKVDAGNATIAELEAQLVKLQDKDAVSKASNASKTVKLGKKAKTAKSKTISLKAITSDSGAKVTYKKSSGSSMIKVSGTKATLKAGAKKGKTYTAKVKATVGSASKTITVKFVIK